MKYYTAAFRKMPPLSPQAAGAWYFAMDAVEYVGEAPAAGGPAPLLGGAAAGADPAAHRGADRWLGSGCPRRRWWDSWWTCPPPRAARTVLCAPCWSSRFSPQDRVQHCMFLKNALLCGSWSSSLISPFLGETFPLVEVLSPVLAASAAAHVDFPAGGGLHGLRPGRFFRRFLDLNRAIMLLGVHAGVEGSVGGPPGSVPRTEFNSPRSSSSSPVCWTPLHSAICKRVWLHRLRCGGRVRGCCVWWLSGACLVAGALRRTRGRDVLCPDGSGRHHGGLRHRGGGSGVRGLASPHSILGATTGSLVRCLRVARDVQFLIFLGYACIVRFAWFDSGCSSCVQSWWLLVAISHISA